MPKGYILIRRNVPPQREIETLKTASSERKVDRTEKASGRKKEGAVRGSEDV
jgi:hypothetical protein